MAVGLAQREIGSANAALRDLQKIQAQQDAIKEQVRIRKEQEDLLRKASNKAMVNQLQSSILPYYGKDAWNAAKGLFETAPDAVAQATRVPESFSAIKLDTGYNTASEFSLPSATDVAPSVMAKDVGVLTPESVTSAISSAPQGKIAEIKAIMEAQQPAQAIGPTVEAAAGAPTQASSAVPALAPQNEAVTGAIAAVNPVPQELAKGAVAGGADIAQAGAEATSIAGGAEEAGALGGLNLGMDQALGALGMGLSVWSLAENGANVGNVSGIVGGGLALASMAPSLALLGPIGLGIGALGGIASLIFDI